MKNTMSTTEIFKYVLLFTFLFSGFLAISITYNKVFKLKNESISIIEKYEGVSDKSLSIINNYLKNSGYSAKAGCNDGEYGIKDLNSTDLVPVDTNDNEKYYYCLSYKCKTETCKIIDKDKVPNGNQIYYNIKLFYKFNLPFIGDLVTFKITGESKGINLYKESQKLS